MEQIAVSVSSAAQALGVGRTTVYELLRAGRLKSVRYSERGRIRIPRAAIEELVANGINEPEPPPAKRATARNGAR